MIDIVVQGETWLMVLQVFPLSHVPGEGGDGDVAVGGGSSGSSSDEPVEVVEAFPDGDSQVLEHGGRVPAATAPPVASGSSSG